MKKDPLVDLLAVVARLRGPHGCPWDRQQTHRSLRYHAVEEVYELIDAIEARDDSGIEEELGDLLLHVVLHCQIARERGAFDFRRVAHRLVKKLVYRHPHVFGPRKLRSAAAVLAQWDRLKAAEPKSKKNRRASTFDGIPRRLPALQRAQKLWKKALRANLLRPGALETEGAKPSAKTGIVPQQREAVARLLFELARTCQERGWNAEELLRSEAQRRERGLRAAERKAGAGRAINRHS